MQQQASATYSLDGMGGMGSLGMHAPAQIQLAKASDLDGERFQMLWMQLPNAGVFQKAYKPGFIANVPMIEQRYGT